MEASTIIIVGMVLIIGILIWGVLNQAGLERKVDDFHIQLNSRMDEFVKISTQLAYGRGWKERGDSDEAKKIDVEKTE